MKNLHLLPTDKPSRLFKFANQLHLDTIPKEYYEKYNIYITSDEEIKEGDAVIHDFGMGYELENPCDSDNLKSNTRSKIILTTDQDLIADGVQAISDEFLKWFVENPTCEFAEIVSELKAFDENGLCISFAMYDTDYTKMMYYVIPQKEAVLAKLGKMNKDLEDALESAFSSKKPNFTEVTINAFSKSMDLTLETEPETLEEAAESYRKEYDTLPVVRFNAFIAGGKWQAEQLLKDDAIQTLEKSLALVIDKQKRMYSEEEVLEILQKWSMYQVDIELNKLNIKELNDALKKTLSYKEWFGQIKKK